MKEEDFIKDLFQKAEIELPTANLEKEIMGSIAQQEAYKKQKRWYAFIGKCSLGAFILLFGLFVLASGSTDWEDIVNVIYVILGIPCLFLVLLLQLESRD